MTARGGEGDDLITGGTGDDVVVLTSGGGADTVTDFDIADTNLDGTFNDQLDVSGLTGGTGPGGAVTFNDVVVTDDGSGNALLSFPGGESVLLQGVAPSSISSWSQLMSAGIPCFAIGTLIRTVDGEVPVEDLKVGDLVVTRDNGPRPLLWSAFRRLGAAELDRAPWLKPVHMPAGAFGNSRPLVVSPQHGVLLSHDGEEILVRAKHLAGLAGGAARVMAGCRRVSYCHLLFERHEVIYSDGMPSESFFPGPGALGGLTAPDATALRALVPDLFPIGSRDETITRYGAPARTYSRRHALPEHCLDFSPVR